MAEDTEDNQIFHHELSRFLSLNRAANPDTIRLEAEFREEHAKPDSPEEIEQYYRDRLVRIAGAEAVWLARVFEEDDDPGAPEEELLYKPRGAYDYYVGRRLVGFVDEFLKDECNVFMYVEEQEFPSLIGESCSLGVAIQKLEQNLNTSRRRRGTWKSVIKKILD